MSAEEKKPVNPFYVALIILGTLFAITACAYGVMMLVTIREGDIPTTAATPLSEQHPMMLFMDRHGFHLLLWELGLLALAIMLAMTTDTIRERRAAARETGDSTTDGKP